MVLALVNILRDVGTVAGAIAVIIGCITLVAKLPPTRFVWERLVADPIGDSFERRTSRIVEAAVEPIKAQLVNNGGSTLRDRVDAIDAKVDAVATRLEDEATKLAESDAALDYRLTAIEHKLSDGPGEGA